MNWKIINKSNTQQPQSGNYSDWKEILAKEGYNQCVYCATRDVRLGGIRNFHVEHFQPKSKFPQFKNIITNLFYCCPICNVYKGNDWHTPSNNFNTIYYPNPSIIDYNLLYSLNENGTLTGKNKTGSYIIVKLGLNRNQLLIDRNFTLLIYAYSIIRKEYDQLFNQLLDLPIINEEVLSMLKELHDAYEIVISKKDILYEAVPYNTADTKKS